MPSLSRRIFLQRFLSQGAVTGALLALAGRQTLCARERLLSRKPTAGATGAQPGLVAASGNAAARQKLHESAIGPAARAAEQSLAVIRQVPGYTSTLVKQEVLRPGTPPTIQRMYLKLRREPFSVYLKYVEPSPGREVLFVEGQNRGKLQVHEPSGLASWVGTVSLAPTSDRVMAENRYPITMVGLEKSLEQLLARWEQDAPHGEANVRQQEDVEVHGISCTLYEVVHPQPRPHFQFQKTQLYIDPSNGMTVRLAGYGFSSRQGGQPVLLEEYTYLDLRTEVALTSHDFDAGNRSYRFK